MILTGKAKEDFEKWINSKYPNGEVWCIPVGWDNGYDFVDDLYDTDEESTRHRLLLSLITEWLDSVGVYVVVMPFYTVGYIEEASALVHDKTWSFYLCEHKGNSDGNSDGADFSSRQEATKAAIEKANEIYNAK